MRVRNTVVLVAAFVLAQVVTMTAQNRNQLVGAWERVSLKNTEGQVTQPPGPAAFVIFSADGYFSQTAIPTGRNKVDKPLQDMSKEELLARFQQVEARRGTYTVAGNKLTRKNIANGNPNQEGIEQTQEFRIEGDVLILTTAGNKAEARFRRSK